VYDFVIIIKINNLRGPHHHHGSEGHGKTGELGKEQKEGERGRGDLHPENKMKRRRL